MSQPTDACPNCGERNLIAVCTVLAEYAVSNDGEADQDWSRWTVDDDSSHPTLIRCDSCGGKFRRFTLDEQGYLVRLGPLPAAAATAPDSLRAEGFREWLASTVADWCRAEGPTPDGEGTDLGDLYRSLDDTEAWDAIGVTLIPVYEDQTLYLVGPQASWLATTGIELGAEGEILWHDPLSNLRLDVPMAELVSYGERLRRRADEVAVLLAGHDAEGGGAARPHVACWAFANADDDVVLFTRTYHHEPTGDEVRHGGYLWYHEDDPEVTDLDGFQTWHDGLCQTGLVSIVPLR